MEVIITGITGFVGQNLKPFLGEKGYLIEGLSLRGNWESRISNQYNAIIHLAGKAHDLRKVADPNEYYQVNFELTKVLYDSFLKSNAKKFIFISSVKAVADTGMGIITEENIPQPFTDYGRSKLMAEEYIRSQKLPEGKSYFILRPCMIHGPGNKGNLNLLYKVVKSRAPYPLAAYKNSRSFLSIANFNFIIHNIISNPSLPTGVYNVADDVALSTNQVIEIISKANGKKAQLWHINQRFINSLARVGDILHLPLNSERLQKLTESYIVSNDKIKEVLNVKHFPITSEEGLLSTIQSFQSR